MKTTWLEENYIFVIGIGFIGASLMLNGGMDTLKTSMNTSTQLRNQRMQMTSEQNLNKILQGDLEAKAQQAEERLTKIGCVPIYSNDGQLTSITEGQPVIDRTRNVPLPDGVCVVDLRGNTAIINDGKMTAVARTGNQELIDQAMKADD